MNVMSILRSQFKRPKVTGCQIFNHSTYSIVEYSEDAVDMPILVDRMKRGQTPGTRVVAYSSMVCNDNAKLLENPPKKIQDPTDVPKEALTRINYVDDTKEEDNANV